MSAESAKPVPESTAADSGRGEVDESGKNAADANEAVPNGGTNEPLVDASDKTAEANKVASSGSTDIIPFTENTTDRPLAKENNASDYEINLAGNRFANRQALIEHIKAMQAGLDAEGSNGKMSDADKFLLFHLVLKHPRIGDKLNNGPVSGFRYGCHARFPQTKCFITLHSDGSEEPVSWMKCVNEAFPGSGPRDRKGDHRGEKRPRDEGDQANQEKEKRPRIEMKEGCIIDIQGLDPRTDYRDLRSALSEFGALKFLELKSKQKPRHSLHKPKTENEMIGHAKSDEENEEKPSVRAKEEAQVEAKEEAKAEAEEASQAKTKEDVKTEAKSDAKDGVTSILGAAKSLLSKVTGSDKKVAKEATLAAKEKEDQQIGKQQEDQESDDEDSEEEDEEDMEPISARARFDCPEAAKKALEELKEFDGDPVQVALLTGEEEKEFWDKLQNYLDTMHEKGKGKGKDGKGKGKGKGKKGKGWDAKGKAKGKKGKGKNKDDEG